MITRKIGFLVLCIFLICRISFSQNAGSVITRYSHKLSCEAQQRISKGEEASPAAYGQRNESTSGVYQSFIRFSDLIYPKIHGGMPKQIDTLFVGPTAADSMTITGNYLQNGPIIVYGDGKLRLKNASLTVLGDIWIWGATAELSADSSNIYSPQQYFYQRSLITAGGGKAVFRN